MKITSTEVMALAKEVGEKTQANLRVSFAGSECAIDIIEKDGVVKQVIFGISKKETMAFLKGVLFALRGEENGQ